MRLIYLGIPLMAVMLAACGDDERDDRVHEEPIPTTTDEYNTTPGSAPMDTPPGQWHRRQHGFRQLAGDRDLHPAGHGWSDCSRHRHRHRHRHWYWHWYWHRHYRLRLGYGHQYSVIRPSCAAGALASRPTGTLLPPGPPRHRRLRFPAPESAPPGGW